MKVVKYSGDVVDFNRDKLKRSLLKSGATLLVVDDVLQTIESRIYDGITTKSIYKMAFALLKKSSGSHAARYNLRTALQQLGPTGFFFEKFVARLFSSQGFDVKTNVSLQGKCVTHEIDVVISGNNRVEMIECKFHSRNDTVSDVKVPMYILSRFNDLKDRKHFIFSENDEIADCRIVTNNRFSLDAITFGDCSGLNLLSWDYPQNQSLRKYIDDNNLYPVTCLTTMSIAEKDKLLILEIILVKELFHNPECLEKIGLSPNRIKNVLREVSELCKYI